MKSEMHPEHLLLMRQLVAAVQDMGCTLKSLNASVDHLVKEKQHRDIGTNTEDEDSGMIKVISADKTQFSITKKSLNYCSQMPSEAPMVRLPALDDQSALASSQFNVGHTERCMDVSCTPVDKSQSGSCNQGRTEISVVKEEAFSDKDTKTNYKAKLMTECHGECDKKEEDDNLTLVLKEEEQSKNRDDAITVKNPLSGVLNHTVKFDTAYKAGCASEKVAASSICEVTAEHSVSEVERVEGQKVEPLGKRKFKCHVCDRMFRTPSQVKVHMRTHSGEKPFSCILCGKAFFVDTNLKRHLQIHFGMKRFVCEHCGKTFSDRSSLSYHFKKCKGVCVQ